MHKLVVLYPEPADPDHFRDYYVTRRGRLRKAGRWPPMWPTTPPAVRSSSTIRCGTAPAEPSIHRLERIGQMRREFM